MSTFNNSIDYVKKKYRNNNYNTNEQISYIITAQTTKSRLQVILVFILNMDMTGN